MPDRMHVADDENTLLLMPCFSKKYFATKLVSVFPQAREYGQPAVNGILVLNDNQSGQPLAVMDGAAVTAQRTGAVGGLGVKLLTSETTQTSGIFGAGVQAFSQARYLLFNRNIQTLYVYSRNKKAAEGMIQRLKQTFPHVTYRVPDHPAQLVENAQVVIAATTSATPLFEASSSMISGKVFISIGSFRPDMQEFPDVVIKTADQVYVDTLFAARESGDIAIPLKKKVVEKEKIKEFAGLFEAVRNKDKMTILFKSVGMALFDLTVASAIYEMALENHMGQELDV